MKVFISYGNTVDQVTALRLQALATVNGLTVYVPPAYTRLAVRGNLDAATRRNLTSADMVLGVVGTGSMAPVSGLELDTAIKLRKRTLVMSNAVFAKHLPPHYRPYLVVVNPANPAQAERDIVQHLKTVQTETNQKTVLVALGTLAISLLLFALAAQE